MGGEQALPVGGIPERLVAPQLVEVVAGGTPGQVGAAQLLQVDQGDFRLLALPAEHHVLVVEAAMLQPGAVHATDRPADGFGQPAGCGG